MKDTAGAMDQLISLQREISTPDGIGGLTKTWADFARVWARVSPVRGGESMTEGRMTATESVRFTIYARGDVDALTRIMWQGVAYNVRHPMAGSDRRITMDVIAERGVAM